ncbi:MAG: Hef nuclease, partial [Spirochaetes bacterium]
MQLNKNLFFITFFVYLKNKFIKPDAIQERSYQLNIAKSALKHNTLVVLPTGLGKTIIALFIIANKLENDKDKIIFLAPTKPLVLQHAKFLRDTLSIDPDKISVFTGEISPDKRKKMWEKSRIIVSTPQVIENDLLSNRINLKDVSFIVFDEAHHAVGEYSYVFISDMYRKQRREDRLILGMTASPGSDIHKIIEVCKNLEITNIEIRTKYDPDVRPYVHDLKILWKEIPLPNDFAYVIQLLRKSLSDRLKILKEMNVVDTSSVSLINRTKLLDAQKKIQSLIREEAKPSKMLFRAASIQSEAMKIYYALELIQTQGVNALKNYFQRMINEAGSKGSTKSVRTLASDKTILEVVAYLRSLDIEHPKVKEIINVIKRQLEEKPDSKIIVFTHYRDTSKYLAKKLESIENVKPVRVRGQAVKNGDKGRTQRQQAEIIKKFKEN